MDKGSNFSPTTVVREETECSGDDFGCSSTIGLPCSKGESGTDEDNKQLLSEESNLLSDDTNEVIEGWCEGQKQETVGFGTDVVVMLTDADGDDDNRNLSHSFVQTSNSSASNLSGCQFERCYSCLQQSSSSSSSTLEKFSVEDVECRRPPTEDEKETTHYQIVHQLSSSQGSPRNSSKISSVEYYSPRCKLRNLSLSKETGKSDAGFGGVECVSKTSTCGISGSSEWQSRDKESVQKRNSLTVPRSSPLSLCLRRSSSLTNLRSNALQCCRDHALTAPSSPDSFYCDSMYSSSYGTASIDLNSLPLTRSLSCSALNVRYPPRSVAISGETNGKPRRYNSSDSAIGLPSEEERSPTSLPNCRLLTCFRLQFQQPPLVDLDSSVPKLNSLCRNVLSKSNSDVSTFPIYDTPSVVVSDHSDQDYVLCLPAADDFPSLDSQSGDGLGCQSFRKLSDCSTCSLASTLSAEDEELDEQQKCVEEDKCQQVS